ncbi:MAG: hypothetical protein ACJA2S_003889 [Cyclobacteriaceae bacterium]
MPVYCKADLKRAFGCVCDVTLLKRLAKLRIPYKREGKDIYVLYRHIEEAFQPEEKIEHYQSTKNNILNEIA